MRMRPRCGLFAAFGVIDHLDDEQASAFVEGQGDRTDDVRLGSDQLDVEPFFYLEGFEGILGFHRRECGAGRWK